MKRTSYTWSVLAYASCSLAFLACSSPLTGPDAVSRPSSAPCGPDAKIEDGEDNNNQGLVAGGRGGYWYTYVDTTGSTVTPTAGAQGGIFQPSPGGANGSQYAMRFYGQISNASIVFSGMGMNFVDPKGPYDASKYQGITFWAKKGAGTTPNVRIKFPDQNTDPDGKVCSACYNDHGRLLKLTDEWTQYYLEFDSLSQEKGWGSPKTSSVELTQMYAIQFQVNDKGQKYDIWIDEMAFTGCQ